MQTRYDPKLTEEKWESFWEEKGYYAPSPGKGETFCMVMPPPNITGVLHMGHALNMTIQDIVTRYKRMSGHEALWIPGIDHAGIATQNVVERMLKSEGASKDLLGRDAFTQRIWEWKKVYGERIFHQMRKLGISCSWGDRAFTMDEEHSKAVREVFVTLFEQGYIYRGDYIINWCPRCQTALSDIEVEYEDQQGKLYHVRYPIKNGSCGGTEYIVVATTRPETMLGDTAVAVNPEDERYKDYKGCTLVLPLMGRVIPVIFDEHVDPKFGTGALKVTPAHDVNDFAIGRRHNLEFINVFNRDGTVGEAGGKYQGMDRYACRDKIVEDLKSNGLLERIEEHPHRIGRCYRCDTVVEPYLSRQWFVRMKELAEKAVDAVRQEKISFYPEYWKRSYFDWLERIHDWCISRQIWWGHQIPVWYCRDCGEIIVSRTDPVSCSSCKSTQLVQDEDVLDTWFSSSLWPFTNLGWPDSAGRMERFYPTSLLCSGWDILFFWVARMVMMGLKFTGKVPFRNVYIHPLIGDENGEKMSKSRGNVVDPLRIIEEYGTDAFRFALVALKTETPYLRFSTDRVRGYRNFVNKIWNASRFVVMNLEDFDPNNHGDDPGKMELCDRWICSRRAHAIRMVTESVEKFSFPQAAQLLYHFIWQDFCDWYLELSKSRLRRSGPAREVVQSMLHQTLITSLRLLHPFMPFVTEEVHSLLAGAGESIMITPWPQAEAEDPEAEQQMQLIMDVVTEIRTIRAEMKIHPQKKVDVLIRARSEQTCRLLREHLSYIVDLANPDNITVEQELAKPDVCASGIVQDVDIFLPLAHLINVDKERERLTRELEEVARDLARTGKKLASTEFLKKAPAPVVEKERVKESDLLLRQQKLRVRIKDIGG